MRQKRYLVGVTSIPTLGGLRPGAKVLEVGAGSLLLSCQLMREGFDVTALEPTGEGFSHFDQMRQMVLDKARSHGCCPTILDLPAERLAAVNCFDYAFSVNVMEHVDDVARVLETVGKSLTVGASYRFTCPNYLFPYEPHFNIPTFFSKQLTERLLGRKIFDSQRVPDPSGTWKSLNWINVVKVGRCVRRLSGLRVTFNRSMLVRRWRALPPIRTSQHGAPQHATFYLRFWFVCEYITS